MVGTSNSASEASLRSIAAKWFDQRMLGSHFIRHIDGNVENNHVNNLQFVNLETALQHVDDWEVDWSMELSDAEELLVMDKANHSRLLSLFAAKFLAEQDVKIIVVPPDSILPGEKGYGFMYSRAERGPLSTTAFLAVNLHLTEAPSANNLPPSIRVTSDMINTLHERAGMGFEVKERQTCAMGSQNQQPMKWLLVRVSDQDVQNLRDNTVTHTSQAFLQAETQGAQPALTKILVLLPLMPGEDRDDYDRLMAVVADMLQHKDDTTLRFGSADVGGKRCVPI